VIDNNDTDTESDTLVITNIAHTNGNTESVTANTTHSNGQSIIGTYGTLTIGANGTYTYVADQDATDELDASDEVDDVFTYTISDGNGGTDTASITVTVTGVNDAPTSTGGTISTNEDENYTLTVNDFNFTDPDDSGSLNKVKITTLETNGNLEYYNGTAWVAVTLNQEITASDITSGYLRFRPDANENGSSYTTFGYQVSDGTVYSSATTMTVNVTPVNDAPVATDDASSVNEDSNVRVRANEDDLLNDDSDPESDSLSVTLIKPLNGSNTSISSGSSTTITGTYGELTVNSNGSYTYRANQDAADTLDTGESAEEKFVYTVSDGNGGTDTGILTITINGVEDNPNAVKDNVSLNISQSLTLTGNAITNDIDPDDSLTIVGCGQGRNPNNGTPKTVGTAFESNYGQMTINADGTYTFVAVSNIKDLLDPGQSVTEKFYYTISDGNSTSTAMIEVTVQRDNVVQELSKKEKKQIKKQIAKDRLNEPSTIRLPNKTTPTKTIEQTADALDSISSTKKLSFNEGIKLVDLVAETGSLTTTDGSLDKVRAKEKDGQLNLKFKVSTDLGNQVVRYEGVMPDGSKLPDWIKVDPQSGKTTTNIPEGVEQVDFIIVTTDQQNNKKEIAVSIDPKEIKADKSIFKQAKKQNASLSVDQNGNVNIVNTNESGEVNQTETKNLNANEKQNSSNNIITQDLNLDNTNDIKNIIDTIKSDQVYQLQTINNGETLEIKVPETLLGNFEKTKLVLKDGSAIPAWVEFDPITGEINANPPEDVDKLEFKLIIERDGEIIVKDLAVDVGSDDNAQSLDDKEDTKFIAFKDQLNKEHDNWEEYGSNIINRL
jgi:VCBS repeat-containing protein